jgi:hypothetical protein
MSDVNEILLSDAKAGLTRIIASLSGQNNLDEAFAAWLLQGEDLGLSLAGPAREAASNVGASRTYQDVAILGFALDAGEITDDERSALVSNLRWLAGSSALINDTPAGVSLDPIAVLGVALGSERIGDSHLQESVRNWISTFISNSYGMRNVGLWRKCLFAAIQRVVDTKPSLAVPTSRQIADVRVALSAKGLLPRPSSMTEDARQALMNFKAGVNLSDEVTRLALSLAAYNAISGQSSSLLKQSTLPGDAPEDAGPKESTVIRVLFLASNPQNQNHLQLEREMAEIDRHVRQAAYRDNFKFEQQWEVRVTELQGHLMRHNPDIVHFSGHGSSSSEIILQDGRGKSHSVSVRALSNLFSALKDNIRCVVLNACFSENQAQAIAKHIDCVVGMSKAISDEAAISFSAKFYQALAYGKSVQAAFNLGCIQTDMEGLNEQDTPKLLHAPDCDPGTVVFT